MNSVKKDCCPHCGGALYAQNGDYDEHKVLNCIWCGQPIVHQEDVFESTDSEDYELPEVKNPADALGKIGAGFKNRNGKCYTTSYYRGWGMFFVCRFLGFLGVHKFVEGKIGMGILYACTAGLFYIGWIVDIIRYLKRAIGF